MTKRGPAQNGKGYNDRMGRQWGRNYPLRPPASPKADTWGTLLLCVARGGPGSRLSNREGAFSWWRPTPRTRGAKRARLKHSTDLWHPTTTAKSSASPIVSGRPVRGSTVAAISKPVEFPRFFFFYFLTLHWHPSHATVYV